MVAKDNAIKRLIDRVRADIANIVTNTYSSTSEKAMSGKAVYTAVSGIDVPTITDTYSATSSDGMSGKAVASALSDKMDKADPTGTGSLSLNRKADTSVGSYSVALGNSCEASGLFSVAVGNGNVASGNYSHAEGIAAVASAKHACAVGEGAVAASAWQTVEGKFNVEDAADTYAHIIGNGISASSRANIHTVDWNGNAWYAGTVESTNTPKCTATEQGTYTLQATVAADGTVIYSWNKLTNIEEASL